MQIRQSDHLSESHVPRMETKDGKAERELRPRTLVTGERGVSFCACGNQRRHLWGLGNWTWDLIDDNEAIPPICGVAGPDGKREVSVAAEEEARPQREAGVCVKVPGFCVVRTHSQVLSSNDMMWFQLEKELCAVSEEGISLIVFVRIKDLWVWDCPMTVSPMLGDISPTLFALWRHFSDGFKKSRFLSWSSFLPAV